MQSASQFYAGETVTPEVLVDIAGKIPREVKDNLWAAIKSGEFKRVEVRVSSSSVTRNEEKTSSFCFQRGFTSRKRLDVFKCFLRYAACKSDQCLFVLPDCFFYRKRGVCGWVPIMDDLATKTS